MKRRMEWKGRECGEALGELKRGQEVGYTCLGYIAGCCLKKRLDGAGVEGGGKKL